MAPRTRKDRSGTPTSKDFLDALSREELLEYLRDQNEAGVRVAFDGKDFARKIARKVQPRCIRTIPTLSTGPVEDRAGNFIIEGENLQAMTTLYRERGNVDLIIADPPYNTGTDFRYNDKWDEDPNDPDLGDLVLRDDGDRHTKWMKFMWPRLQLMRDMLKPTGVLAICIDHRELFRLGQMLDELFREGNRIAIINWQRSYTPRNDSTHVSFATEYVLIYARDEEQASTGLLPRKEFAAGDEMPDGDPIPWTDGPATGSNAKNHKSMVYAIQSPFTGKLLYPPEGSAWRYEQAQNLEWLKEWGCRYKSEAINDAKVRAKVIGVKVAEVPSVEALLLDEPLERAAKKASAIYEQGPWPRFYFLSKGLGRPRIKKYVHELRQGLVPTTFWATDEYDTPTVLGSVSWKHQHSGHSEQAVDELTAIVGPGHDFKTVKPVKLFEKIVQLWCPPNGLVLDPFAGSGTTAHAVLKLNAQTQSLRRFVLIEQGRPERGDSYARSLTADRVKRVITGKWRAGKRDPVKGGFEFRTLQNRVDARALLGMEREEMADIVIASHFDSTRRGYPALVRLNGDGHKYLVARNGENEGFYLVWNGSRNPPVLNEKTYEAIAKESANEGLRPIYHVYARFATFQSEDVRFYQIPDRILMDFGLSLSDDAFNTAN